MLFNSIPFVVFAFLFFGLWPILKQQNTARWLWITLMSFVFYAWWDWRFLFLLIGTGSLDYFCGKAMLRWPKAKAIFLYLSVLTNLASLLVFKYSLWLAELLDLGLQQLGINAQLSQHIPAFTLVLPVGISFYTFNSLSYTIDIYRNKAQPAKNLLHFMAFIAFFPHLVAGPIIRAKEVLNQLLKVPAINRLEQVNGLKLILWGLFQKMVLADNIAIMVNDQFTAVTTHASAFSWWYTMLGFSLQIYFDFNGYSTIARGLAKWCGIHFKWNFNHPYLAASFSEFWQRWHRSLSSFFRDYVYIPLGGNRCSPLRNLLNRWITMLLSGLWHGANLTFLVWGGLHAAFLSLESLLFKVKRFKYPIVVSIGALLAWVFFRAEQVSDAAYILQQMFTYHPQAKVFEVLKNSATVWIFIGMCIETFPWYKSYFKWRNLPWIQIGFWASIACACILFRGPVQSFIYFQF